MTTSVALAAAAVLIFSLSIASCAAPVTPAPTPPPPQTALAPSPSPTAAPTALPTVPPASLALTVTLSDDGRVVSLETGDRFLVSLDASYDWTVTVDDLAIVSRMDGVAGPTGSQGVFRALAAGRTTLSAVGDPPCRQVKPACGAPSRLFRVTVVVR